MRRPSGSATASITMEKAPASATASGVRLNRRPIAFVAPLGAERSNRVDRLGREADMAHDRHTAFDQKRNGLRYAPAALDLDCAAAGLLHHPSGGGKRLFL